MTYGPEVWSWAAATGVLWGLSYFFCRVEKKGAYMKKSVPVELGGAFLDQKIKALGDWRGKTLAKVREIIPEVDLEIVRGMEVGEAHLGRDSSLVPRRRYLHGRDLQERGEADVL